MVQPVCDLLHRGGPLVWGELLLLARWGCQLWPDYPPADWTTEHSGKHCDFSKSAPLDIAGIHGLYHDLRRWVPQVLSGLDADTAGAELMLLERHGRSLLSSLDNLTSDAKGSKHRRRYDADFLIRCLLASMCLRHQKTMPKFVDSKIIPLLPAALQPLARSSLERGAWKLPTWDVSHELMLDTAMMLCRRDTFSSSACRYAFADSSPQGDRDWLICVLRTIRQDCLRECTKAAGDLAILAIRR